MRSLAATIQITLVLASASTPARAESGGAGVYGLLDTDFVLAAGAGGSVHAESAGGGGGGLAELRLRYLATVALVAGYDVRPTGHGLDHAALAAMELRPLFLPLFFENRFSGNATGDLVLYGLGLTGGLRADGEGLSLVVGLGTEWPLWRDRSRGWYLRTELRGRFADASWQGSNTDVTEGAALLLLQYHAPLDLVVVR